jgi:hypothetical protein
VFDEWSASHYCLGRIRKMTADKRYPSEMNDAELAEYYYANRDSVVGDEDVGVRIAKRLESVVPVRFTPSELTALEQSADAAGLKLSTYIRQAALSNSSVICAAWKAVISGLSGAVGRAG